jgi:hypothetical protein
VRGHLCVSIKTKRSLLISLLFLCLNKNKTLLQTLPLPLPLFLSLLFFFSSLSSSPLFSISSFFVCFPFLSPDAPSHSLSFCYVPFQGRFWQLVDCPVDDLPVGDLEEFSGDFSKVSSMKLSKVILTISLDSFGLLKYEMGFGF